MAKFSNLIKNILPVVQTVAPSLATALGGPLAGAAVAALSNALLGKPDATPEELEQAILPSNPDMLLKMKEADQKFQIQMRELDIDIDRLENEDRDSARKREMELKDKAPAAIAAFSFIGFFGILAALIFIEIPPESAAPLNIMLGTLGGIVASIAAYYYGSSRGSAEKNKMIDRLKSTK